MKTLHRIIYRDVFGGRGVLAPGAKILGVVNLIIIVVIIYHEHCIPRHREL